MKQVVLSFDDSRSDFYTRAFPILKHYNLPSTLNVITGFITNTISLNFSSSKKAITKDELLELEQSGLVEIACHGSNHLNTKEDVQKNIEELKMFGINVQGIGFASPNSVLTWGNKNENGIWDLINSGELSYIRSGTQIRREGYLYIIKSIIERFTHSPRLFYNLNKRNLVLDDNIFLPSVSIYSYTTISEIKYFINHMPENASVVFMFHSILNQSDYGYRRDKYYWPEENFKELCGYLKECDKVEVCTTKELIF